MLRFFRFSALLVQICRCSAVVIVAITTLEQHVDAQSLPIYRSEDLGCFPNLYDLSTQLSDDDEFAGTFAPNQSSQHVAFSWSPRFGLRTIASGATARAINRFGAVVGLHAGRAYQWKGGEEHLLLSDDASVVPLVATSISANGWILGIAVDPRFEFAHLFITKSFLTPVITIPEPPSPLVFGASAINDAGLIAGSLSSANEPARLAFFDPAQSSYRAAGGAPPPFSDWSVYANNFGVSTPEIVVGRIDSPLGYESRAFIAQAGTIRLLDHRPPSPSAPLASVAVSASPNGVVVGTRYEYSVSANGNFSASNFEAVVSNGINTFVSLRQLVLNRTGNLQSAIATNKKGHILVSGRAESDQCQHLFLLR